jgi:hypothetical protein
MFFDDRKKAVTTILSKRNKKGEVTMNPTPVKTELHMNEGGEIDGRHAAAQDILGAHHSKSPEKLMQALANFIDLHLHQEQGNAPEPTGKEPDRDPI